MVFVFLAEAFTLYVVSWFLWRIFRQGFKLALDNVPGPPAKSFWKGSFPDIFSLDGWAFHKDIAEKYGRVIKIKAFLGENKLYVFDPKALHHILVKDQDMFESAFITILFGEGVVGTLGEQHRKQRKMLNPVFSIAHMREMKHMPVPIFYNVTYKLRAAIANKVKDGPREIEIMSWMTRTALELIGQSGLGYSFDPLTEDAVPHPFSIAAKKLVPTFAKMAFSSTYLLAPLSKIGTPKFQRFVIDILPWKNLHEVRDVVDVLHNTSVEIFESKKKALVEGDEALAHQIGQGKDIMSILMRANMSTSQEDSLTREELLGQITSLTFAAMDTTSAALSRVLHLLATHQDVQDKLRKEIKEAKEEENGDLPYDKLVSLPYLDAICRESLRLHPPLTYVRRIARQDVLLPLSTPIKGLDGQEMGEIPIPKNTDVFVGIMASNRNPELWGPDADEWIPERWLSPLPETLTAANLSGIYSHLMTFIGGGRACIVTDLDANDVYLSKWIQILAAGDESGVIAVNRILPILALQEGNILANDGNYNACCGRRYGNVASIMHLGWILVGLESLDSELKPKLEGGKFLAPLDFTSEYPPLSSAQEPIQQEQGVSDARENITSEDIFDAIIHDTSSAFVINLGIFTVRTISVTNVNAQEPIQQEQGVSDARENITSEDIFDAIIRDTSSAFVIKVLDHDKIMAGRGWTSGGFTRRPGPARTHTWRRSGFDISLPSNLTFIASALSPSSKLRLFFPARFARMKLENLLFPSRPSAKTGRKRALEEGMANNSQPNMVMADNIGRGR
ncbi:cytochrome P450 [Flammula alnicola]|nr:cytochrome P450 [Flammula alnicola]